MFKFEGEFLSLFLTFSLLLGIVGCGAQHTVKNGFEGETVTNTAPQPPEEPSVEAEAPPPVEEEPEVPEEPELPPEEPVEEPEEPGFDPGALTTALAVLGVIFAVILVLFGGLYLVRWLRSVQGRTRKQKRRSERRRSR